MMLSLIHLQQCESTQNYLKSKLEKHSSEHLSKQVNVGVYTFDQSGGHGRGGKGWISPPGNLATSFVMRIQTKHPTLIPLATAIAITKTSNNNHLLVKWPNDILISPTPIHTETKLNFSELKKCSGILVDALGNDLYLIGCGFNNTAQLITLANQEHNIPAGQFPISFTQDSAHNFINSFAHKIMDLMQEDQIHTLNSESVLYPKKNQMISLTSHETQKTDTVKTLGYDKTGALLTEDNKGLQHKHYTDTIRLL